MGPGVFGQHFAFWRIVGWRKKRRLGLNMHTLVRRYLPRWRIRDGGIEMFRPYVVNIERCRYRAHASRVFGDATVAATLVHFVVEPHNCGLGG